MSKSLVFHCTWMERNETSERIGALISTLETYDDPETGNYLYLTHYCNHCHYLHYDILYQLLLNQCWLISKSCRMVGVCWIACGIRAWLQKTYPVRRSHSEYPGQTYLFACRWHWYYPAQHVQRLSGRSWRPEAGRRRWMLDVVQVRQLVGVGMVPWPVIKLTGLPIRSEVSFQ